MSIHQCHPEAGEGGVEGEGAGPRQVPPGQRWPWWTKLSPSLSTAPTPPPAPPCPPLSP